MKLLLIAALGLSLSILPAGAADEPSFKTDKEKASYSVGIDVGNHFKGAGLEGDMLDYAAVASGIRDAVSGGKVKLSEDEMKAAMQVLQKQLTEKAAAKATASKAEGDKFLAANSKKDGVKTTASGLQYKVLTDGTGKTPKDGDRVTTHYKGTLVDGTQFDSSYSRNQPATFGVNEVIPGWTEALKMMKEGSKWQLVIPSGLAYGPDGRPPVIPPDATLVFDIELIKIEGK